MTDNFLAFYEPIRSVLQQIHRLADETTQLWQDATHEQPTEQLQARVQAFHQTLTATQTAIVNDLQHVEHEVRRLQQALASHAPWPEDSMVHTANIVKILSPYWERYPTIPPQVLFQ